MLLDTNVLIRMTAFPDTLGPVAWDLIEGGPVYASSISHFEITMKRMLGKLDAPDDLVRLFGDQGITPLPFTERHAARVAKFEVLSKHDPFDRILVAQAAAEGLEFMTSDRILLGLGYDWIVDARK